VCCILDTFFFVDGACASLSLPLSLHLADPPNKLHANDADKMLRRESRYVQAPDGTYANSITLTLTLTRCNHYPGTGPAGQGWDPECKKLGLEVVPSWITKDGKVIKGTHELADLAAILQCAKVKPADVQRK
jgi:hypothetical protein